MIFISTVVLIACFLAYTVLAKKFNIVDNPNVRSSHYEPTIRGGGVIFFLACVLHFVLFDYQYPYFFIGLALIAIISFLDDIYTLSAKIRFPVQLLSIVLIMYEIQLFNSSPYLVVPIVILATGFLNIYNFMDGINGITGIYSIAISISLLYVNNVSAIRFIDNELLVLVLISLVIFGLFNFRKKAKVFAGDIGSIAIGLTIIFSIGKLVHESQDILYLLFGAVYAIDGGLTLLERLIIRKENIFEPHRRHLYQVMVDSKVFGHLTTSIIYGVLQLIICSLVIVIGKVLSYQNQLLVFGLLVLALIVLYVMFKRNLLSRKRSSVQA